MKKNVCVLCGKELEFYGHSPFPIRRIGRCCEKCNWTYVIPIRIAVNGTSKDDYEPFARALYSWKKKQLANASV